MLECSTKMSTGETEPLVEGAAASAQPHVCEQRIAEAPEDRRTLALRAIDGMLSALVLLGDQSESHRIRNALSSLRDAVRSKLNAISCSPREKELMQWAQARGMTERKPFDVQGTLIRKSIPWMATHAEMLNRQMPSCALDLKALQTAGYRVIKTCAMNFNPAIHGQDFWVFAEPFVTAAMRNCLSADYLIIDDHVPMSFLQSLLVEDTRNPKKNVAASSLPQTTNTERAPKRVELRTEPPPAPPASAQMTPEEEEEYKRRRRFCRWAKDAHAIPVDQHQFDEAVGAIAEKYHPLAKGVVNAMTIPSSLRGGKSAVRREALRILPDIVRSFEPPAGEHAPPKDGQLSPCTVQFKQHVEGQLRQKLDDFVKGKERKRK